MAIITFDNFKFDNTAAAIPATNWGVFTSAGSTFANAFTKNGYSSSGLDLSITTTGAVAHGSSYVAKSNITQNNTNIITPAANFSGPRLALGFSVSKYPQSGSMTIEPQLTSDMTPYIGTNSTAVYNGDGSHMIVSRYNSATSQGIVELWVRNTGGSNAYTFITQLLILPNATGFSTIRFSQDGLYWAIAYSVTGGSSLFIFKRSGPTTNAYNQVFTSTGLSGSATSLAWNSGGSVIVGTGLSPFVYFFFKNSSSDAWTKTPNPSTLPATTVNAVTGGTDSIVGVICSAGSFVYLYSIGSTSAPSFIGSTFTGLSNPIGFDMNNSLVTVIGTNTAPFIKIYTNTAGATLSFPDTLVRQPTTIKFNPEGTMFTIAYNTDGFAPATYKLSGNPLSVVNVGTTPLPSVGTKDIVFSADNNYTALSVSTASASTQGFYTFDNQVNVIATISPGMVEGSTSSDNYGYSGGTSRFSITVQDEFLGLRYYSANTGGVYPVGRAISSRAVGFVDNNFTNAYIEWYLNNSNTSTLTTTSALYLNGTPVTVQVALTGTTSMLPATDFSSFFSGNVSVSFKRDINVSSATTLNCVVSDFYMLDASGPINTAPLGVCSVVQEPLLSDKSKQWTSTGPNSYSVLSNNPPDPSAYVSSNTIGATDIINLDNTFNTNAYASKISIKAKVTSPTSSTGLTLVDGDNLNVLNTRLTPAFKEYNYTSELHSTYVAAATTTIGGQIVILKLAPKSATPTQLPVIGLSSTGTGNATAMVADGSVAALGLVNTAAPYVQIFNRKNDVYTATSQTFPDITTAVALLEYSYDGKYLAIRQGTPNSTVTIYSVVGDVYTKITDLSTTAAITAIKFSKGGKYLFVGTNTGSTANKIYSINSSTNTFTPLTSPVTASISCMDTVIDLTQTVEYVLFGLNTSPWLAMYKINNNDTFTAATVTTQSLITQNPTSVAFSTMLTPTSNANISIIQNSTTNTGLATAYVTATNTLASATSAGQAASTTAKLYKSVSKNAFAILAPTSGGALTYTYVGSLPLNSGIPVVAGPFFTLSTLVNTSISMAELVENYNTIGYTYTL
jgi:hypothetical protein